MNTCPAGERCVAFIPQLFFPIFSFCTFYFLRWLERVRTLFLSRVWAAAFGQGICLRRVSSQTVVLVGAGLWGEVFHSLCSSRGHPRRWGLLLHSTGEETEPSE